MRTPEITVLLLLLLFYFYILFSLLLFLSNHMNNISAGTTIISVPISEPKNMNKLDTNNLKSSNDKKIWKK